MDYLEFPSLLLFLSAYFIIERFIKIAFQHVNPTFYDQLYHSRKDVQYFVFIMGIIITLTTTPVCYSAFRSSTPTNDALGHPNLPPSGQLCLAPRAVLWASELNRLDHSNRYVIHHLSSLFYLVYHLLTSLPSRILYLFYASLATELFSDTACLLTLHGRTPEESKLAYAVHLANLMVIVGVRLPPCVFAVSFLRMHWVGDLRFWLNVGFLAVYTWYNVNAVFVISKRLQVWKFLVAGPGHGHSALMKSLSSVMGEKENGDARSGLLVKSAGCQDGS